jgi:hypothetical protein
MENQKDDVSTKDNDKQVKTQSNKNHLVRLTSGTATSSPTTNTVSAQINFASL